MCPTVSHCVRPSTLPTTPASRPPQAPSPSKLKRNSIDFAWHPLASLRLLFFLFQTPHFLLQSDLKDMLKSSRCSSHKRFISCQHTSHTLTLIVAFQCFSMMLIVFQCLLEKLLFLSAKLLDLRLLLFHRLSRLQRIQKSRLLRRGLVALTSVDLFLKLHLLEAHRLDTVLQALPMVNLLTSQKRHASHEWTSGLRPA